MMQTLTQRTADYLRTTLTVSGKNYSALLFNSCHDPLFSAVGCPSIFQQQMYHAALEAAPPDQMDFWYVRLESEGQFAGMLSFQVKSFNPGESLRNQGKQNIWRWLQYRGGRVLRMKVLCLGNTLVTGDYGFCFQPDITPSDRTLLMMETIDWMMAQKAFRHVSLIFVKDFYDDIFKDLKDSPYCQRYHAIDTQPSMIMDIAPGWTKFDDYLGALKSKYRVRARKAMSQASHLERIELDLEAIEQLEQQLHELYLKVVDDVGFNLFILSPGYFTELKRKLGDHFRLWIYKDKGELISFYTVLEDGDVLDAHFLGYDPDVNHHYKLYMNMLLSMIDQATTRGFRQLQLSRTATEIKSSVGAEGVPMWAYLRHRRGWINAIMPAIYNFFKPDLSWTPRSPFHLS